jgi:Flp pilus assembly protein TadB
MKLLAAASAGFLGFAGMGWLLGHPVALRPPRWRARDETRADRRRRWLRQAGAGVSPLQFYGASAAAGLAAFALLWAATGAWVVALVPAALCGFAPQLYYAHARKRRVAAVNQAWPDGLRDLVASVHQQLPLHQAVLELARGGPAPLRQALAHYPVHARALGTVAALEHVKEELADPASDRVLEVLVLAAERGAGGDLLARLLGDLAESVTADLRVEEDIETARTEPRINMAVAAALPWLLLLAMVLGDTPQRGYYTSGRGLGPVLLAAGMTFAGVAAVRALSRDPVEARLFVGEEEARR